MSTGSAATIDRFIDALWIEDGLAANTLAAYRRDSYESITNNMVLRGDQPNDWNGTKVYFRPRPPEDYFTLSYIPKDANGNILPTRVRPSNSGFGQATQWQPPRTVQLQIRFSF